MRSEEPAAELPARDDWEYLGKWVARKLEMDEGASIYDVMGRMHGVVGDARMFVEFVRRQKVVMSQHDHAELLSLRRTVAEIGE